MFSNQHHVHEILKYLYISVFLYLYIYIFSLFLNVHLIWKHINIIRTITLYFAVTFRDNYSRLSIIRTLRGTENSFDL